MKLRFVLACTFHQFNSHLWHVLFVWCVRWSFAARSIRFLLSFVPLRTERKQKMPVIHINRFLLCVASRARGVWRLASDFLIDFTTLTNSRRFFVVVVNCLKAMRWRFRCRRRRRCHWCIWNFCALNSIVPYRNNTSNQPAHTHRTQYIFPFSMKNY